MSSMDKERQPVIVGVGRYTQHLKNSTAADRLSPIGLAVEAAIRASRDTGLDADGSKRLLNDLVAIGTPGMFYETRWISKFGKKPYKNFSRSVANKLGAKPDQKFCWRSFPGGNGPQFMVSQFGSLISKGEIPQGPILIGGAEGNGTFDAEKRSGNYKLLKELNKGWDDGNDIPEDKPVVVNRLNRSDSEAYQMLIQNTIHGLSTPLVIYPMFENCYADKWDRSLDEQLASIGDLYHRFSVVAAANAEHSWYPDEKSPSDITTITEENRMMAYPYTKNMVARDEVDQSAMIIMMSWAEAERRGIPEDKLVFLWGSGDAYDEEVMPLRHQFHSSISMKVAYSEAFASAGMDINKWDDVERIKVSDIYSCFPVAVQQGCDILGYDPKKMDINKMTVTGGLSYHGGPGSNYVSHSICAVIEKLRTGYFRGELGLVGANGGMLTEHSVGIYSTNPPSKTYTRREHEEYQGDYGLPLEQYAMEPNGIGKIIGWTVEYKKKPNIPQRAIIIGEMVSGDDKGKRFCANSKPGDTKTLKWLLSSNQMGKEVSVEAGEIEELRRGKIALEARRVWFSSGNTSSL